MAYKYTDQQLIEAVKTSTSVRQVLAKLGLKEAGGNYACTKQKIAKMGLTIDHFTGMGWSKNKKRGPKRDLQVYLNNEYKIGSNALRKRLIREGLKDHKCECCGITEWNGKPAPLELDHIDGNHYNNNIDNLQILCPNCHAQTDTYRGKNRGT